MQDKEHVVVQVNIPSAAVSAVVGAPMEVLPVQMESASVVVSLAVDPAVDPLCSPRSEEISLAAVIPAIQEETIGRFTRAALEAMRGKRGRKPPEYHQLFPQEQRGVVAKPGSVAVSASRAEKTPKATKSQPRTVKNAAKIPSVSSAMIGQHTIDDLLEMIGTRGAKPVAYTILQKAAQIFAERKAIDLSKVFVPDPLALRIVDAPKQVRVSIELLLDAVQRKR